MSGGRIDASMFVKQKLQLNTRSVNMDFSQMTAEELYQYGIDNPDTPYADELVDKLLKDADVEELLEYGVCNPNTPYADKLVDALLKTADIEAFVVAGEEWSDSVYSERILDELVKYGDFVVLINDLIKRVEDGCSSYYVVDDLIEGISYEFLMNSGIPSCSEFIQDVIDNRDKGPDYIKNNYSENNIHNMLGLINFGRSLPLKRQYFTIGMYWPDGRYDDIMVDYLIKTEKATLYTGNKEIIKAINQWPKYRYDERLLRHLFDTGYTEDLIRTINYKGEDFAVHIADKLLCSRDAAKLYELGCKIDDKYFVPEIAINLYRLNNQEYTEKAKTDWSESRASFMK